MTKNPMDFVDSGRWKSVLIILLVRVLQRNRTNRIHVDMQKEIYYEELAQVIVETVKSHSLTSAHRSSPNPKAQEPG